LARPNLRDRGDVLDRLADLYGEWDQPAKQAAVIAQQEQLRGQSGRSDRVSPGAPAPSLSPPSPPARKPGRNEPCWCGSGKKYKRCHLSSDQAAERARRI